MNGWSIIPGEVAFPDYEQQIRVLVYLRRTASTASYNLSSPIPPSPVTAQLAVSHSVSCGTIMYLT